MTSWNTDSAKPTDSAGSRFVPDVRISNKPRFFLENAGNEVSLAAWKSGVMGALNFAAHVLAVRMIVLVAVTGAIGLTWQALADPVLYRVLAVGVYSMLVVIPVVWLSATGRG